MVEDAGEVPSQPVRIDRRTEMTRVQRNLRRRRVAFAIIGVLLLVIVGIILAGYVVIFVRPPQQLVIRVNDVEYTRGDMVKQLRVQQKGLEFRGQQLNLGVDVFDSLSTILEDEIITQAAPSIGITVTTDELEFASQLQINPFGDFDLNDPQGLREFNEQYNSYLNTLQISDAENKNGLKRQILRQKVRQFVGDSVPFVVEQAHVYRLTLFMNDEMDVMQTKYKDATRNVTDPEELARAFKDIVREFSRENPESVRRGGDLGWMPEGILARYDDITFGTSYRDPLEIGKLSDPVPDVDNANQGVVFMVSERDPARELSPANRETLKDSALQVWINDQRKNFDVYAVMNSDVYAWIIAQMGISTTITPTPAPDNLIPGLPGAQFQTAGSP